VRLTQLRLAQLRCFSEAELDFAPRLKWIQSGGAGMEGMLDDNHRKSPVVITNYARTFAHGISEVAIGHLLCLSHGIAKYMYVFGALTVLTSASFFTYSSYWPYHDTPAVAGVNSSSKAAWSARRKGPR